MTNPDFALSDEIAAKIITVGMRDGIFTGKRLADYFTAVGYDWLNARRIINGTDRDSDIAGYGKKFQTALMSAA